MITVRPSDERGHARHGWLDSRHTFSFAEYYDPRFMGFSDLRVINDDWVDPGAGFGAHPHQDMEIITYVLEGAIEHRDTMNNVSRLNAGEIQVMSAGTGVLHSEYNASDKARLNFLQIWIMPNERGARPRYAQKDFSASRGITRVVSPDGADGSLAIRQTANIYRIALDNETQKFETANKRVYYIQVARGEMNINGTALTAGDGAYIGGEDLLVFEAPGMADALLFELRGK